MNRRCGAGPHRPVTGHQTVGPQRTGRCAHRGGLYHDPDAVCRRHRRLLTGWVRTDTEWSRERGRR